MTSLDYVKAFGVAVLLMALNIGISFPVVAVYAYFIDPGHEASYYEAAAQRIAPWSSVVAGSFLFFAAAWFFGARRPQRSALTFAMAFTAIYTVIDLGVVVAAGAMAMIGVVVAISVAAKFAAAFFGARMVKRA